MDFSNIRFRQRTQPFSKRDHCACKPRLGSNTIFLCPKHLECDYLEEVINHEISEYTIIRILKKWKIREVWLAHMVTFFAELPRSLDSILDRMLHPFAYMATKRAFLQSRD
jgi:predicted SprT family Zn-dependent metalloprotease